MLNQTYPHELQLSKLIFLIPKPSFWMTIYLFFKTDLSHPKLLLISLFFFFFFTFLDGDVPRSTFYGVYIP